MDSLVARFAALFAGHRSAYGKYNNLLPPDERGKRLGGERVTVRQPVTEQLYADHLSGKSGLGITPIREDSMALFGACDIDLYDGSLDHAGIARVLHNHRIPMFVCRSKSGGAHCYLFASEAVPAAKMIAKLKEISAILGQGGCEVFPAQSKLHNENDCGFWINLPYMEGMTQQRYCVTATGDALTLEEFLAAVEEARQPAEWFERPLVTSADMPQGPPCLQHLTQIGFPSGTRNIGLYNLGVYCRKADPDNWVQMLEEMNRKYMQPPLDASEVHTISQSLKKKVYNYQCNTMPLTAHCNSALCRSRKFGVGRGENQLPELGKLRKLETTPPIWYWEVNGRSIELTTEQLLDPSEFQKVCANKLTFVPVLPKRDVWLAAVNKAMEEYEPLPPLPEDSTTPGQFWEHLRHFCTGRVQAHSKEELLLGRPWTNDGRTYFSLGSLQQHLDRNRFKELKTNQIISILRDPERNGQHHKWKIKGVFGNYWSIPEFARQTEGFDVPENLNEGEDKPF